MRLSLVWTLIIACVVVGKVLLICYIPHIFVTSSVDRYCYFLFFRLVFWFELRSRPVPQHTSKTCNSFIVLPYIYFCFNLMQIKCLFDKLILYLCLWNWSTLSLENFQFSLDRHEKFVCFWKYILLPSIYLLN